MTQSDIRDDKLRHILYELVVPEIAYATEDDNSTDLAKELANELLHGNKLMQHRSVSQAIKQLTFSQSLTRYYANAAFLTDRTFDIWQRKNTIKPDSLALLNKWRFLTLALLWQDPEKPYTRIAPLIDLADESYRLTVSALDNKQAAWRECLDDIESMLFSRLILEPGYLSAVGQQWIDFERQIHPIDQEPKKIVRMCDVYVAAASGLQKIVEAQENQRKAAAEKAKREAENLAAQKAQMEAETDHNPQISEPQPVAEPSVKEDTANHEAERLTDTADLVAEEKLEQASIVKEPELESERDDTLTTLSDNSSPVSEKSEVEEVSTGTDLDRALDTITLLEDEEDSEGSEAESSESMEEAESIVNALNLHDWIAVQEESEQQRYKLIVMLKNSGKYIFVDRFGVKKQEYRYQALVEAFHNEKVRLLAEGKVEDSLERTASRLRMRSV